MSGSLTPYAEGSQDVVRRLHEEPAQEPVAALGDRELPVRLARLVLARHDAEVRADVAAPLEAAGIVDHEHEGERSQDADARHLSQELRHRVHVAAQALDLVVVLADRTAQRSDRGDDGIERRAQFLWDRLRRVSLETLRRTARQPLALGLHDAARAVDELRARFDEESPRPHDGEVPLHRLAAVADRHERHGSLGSRLCEEQRVAAVVLLRRVPDHAQLPRVGDDHLVTRAHRESADPGRASAALHHHERAPGDLAEQRTQRLLRRRQLRVESHLSRPRVQLANVAHPVSEIDAVHESRRLLHGWSLPGLRAR